jgi:glycosyltransferase involved in cell wall biosynthesis
MKVLLATDTYHPDVNGAAYFTYRLATSLAKRGHNVSVMCPSRSFKNTVSDDEGVKVYGIRSIPLPLYLDFRVSPLSVPAIIRGVVKKISPDIVHIQNHFLIGKQAVSAAKKLHIPAIGTNHFMPENLIHYLHPPGDAEKQLQQLAWRQCVKVFEQLDFVATPTKTAATLLKNAGLGKDIVPISCGIDLERFNPTNDGSYLKQRFAIPNNKPVLLCVGRLDKEKRIDVILRGLLNTLHVTSAHLVLAGIGREKQRLEKLTGELGIEEAVTFTGFIPDKDLQNIYRVADLFVTAGIAELQSIVTMEAMASGLPVVAVNAMALPELVHDGENGYLFSEGDSQMLADKVVSILGDQTMRAQMSRKSLDIIKDHDINKIVEKYESIYTKIITR